MATLLKEGNYAYIQINGLIEHKSIGLFNLNGEFMIRRLLYKKDKFVLRADNRNIKDVTVNGKDYFQIIGKVYV